jgi:pimeloyl-ACP methyl ester carboxylesterase
MKRMRRISFLVAGCAFVALVTAAAVQGPRSLGAATLAQKPRAAGRTDSTLVDISGRRLFAKWGGVGQVTVVLEAGQGASSTAWTKVFPELSSLTRTFAYDRAGLGRSDPVNTPITPQATVDDLTQLLRRTGQRPPYILVGWSQGAIYVRLFARSQPSAIAAILLVDPAPDGLLDWLHANKPAAEFARADSEMRAAGGGVTAEWIAGPSVFAASKIGWPLPAVPVTIISAMDVPAQPAWWNPPLRAYMRTEARAIAARTPGSRIVDAERSGHFVPGDRPDLIIAEVKRLLHTVDR